MTQHPLTVIAQIKAGQEAPLRQVLEAIAADLSNNPYLKLAQSSKTHFLRLAITTDPDHGPRLLMAGNYDGDLDSYLDELLQIGPDIDAIWNTCEGYQGRASFAAFIRDRSYKAQAIFIALRGETVADVRRRIAVRTRLEDLLDLDPVADYLEHPGLKPLLNDLFSLRNALSLWQALGAVSAQFWTFIGDSLGFLLDALRRIALALVLFLGRILGAPEQNRQTGEYIGVEVDQARTRLLTLPEVINGQNHLHLLSTIRPGRTLRLRIVLFLANLTFRFLFPPGSLADIRTIHFAHWVILDEGKRLLFVTHYDGSFDNYLGDFADRAGTGLNSIWNNVEGYPVAGGADLVGFKQFFRNDQQLPSQVFYRAYPEVSVQNRLRDRQITQTLADQLQRSALEDWLSLL